MPWSAKAQQLLIEQYAPVGVAGSALSEAVVLLRRAAARQIDPFEVSQLTSGQNADMNALLNKYEMREIAIEDYITAYRNYCWPVLSLNDFKLAPFHLLATEKGVHTSEDHLWHMQTIKRYFATPNTNAMIISTNHISIDVTDAQSVESGTRWWEELTSSGGEGMVVKPIGFIVKNNRELLQPAVKCRGREYLRIIYGPEYTLEGNIERLKKRSLSRKRSLALREFALGMESLERFVRKEPLYRVHECAFGVLALESEPVDPRL